MAGFLLQAAVRRTPVAARRRRVRGGGAGRPADRLPAPAAGGWPGTGRPSRRTPRALDRLDLEPVVDFGMRLGEGTGALVALPVLRGRGRDPGGDGDVRRGRRVRPRGGSGSDACATRCGSRWGRSLRFASPPPRGSTARPHAVRCWLTPVVGAALGASPARCSRECARPPTTRWPGRPGSLPRSPSPARCAQPGAAPGRPGGHRRRAGLGSGPRASAGGDAPFGHRTVRRGDGRAGAARAGRRPSRSRSAAAPAGWGCWWAWPPVAQRWSGVAGPGCRRPARTGWAGRRRALCRRAAPRSP